MSLRFHHLNSHVFKYPPFLLFLSLLRFLFKSKQNPSFRSHKEKQSLSLSRRYFFFFFFSLYLVSFLLRSWVLRIRVWQWLRRGSSKSSRISKEILQLHAAQVSLLHFSLLFFSLDSRLSHPFDFRLRAFPLFCLEIVSHRMNGNLEDSPIHHGIALIFMFVLWRMICLRCCGGCQKWLDSNVLCKDGSFLWGKVREVVRFRGSSNDKVSHYM